MGKKHACLQIDLLEPETLTHAQTSKMITSTINPKKGTVQAAHVSVDGATFTPRFLRRRLICSGLTAKEGLHEHEGHDSAVVAKTPKLMRYQPPPSASIPIRARWLRATWFPVNCAWEKVEGRERIGKHIERAVWQFHPNIRAFPDRCCVDFRAAVQDKPYASALVDNLPPDGLRTFNIMMRYIHGSPCFQAAAGCCVPVLFLLGSPHHFSSATAPTRRTCISIPKIEE